MDGLIVLNLSLLVFWLIVMLRPSGLVIIGVTAAITCIVCYDTTDTCDFCFTAFVKRGNFEMPIL